MDKVKVVDYLENIGKHLGADAWKGEVQRLALQGLKLGGTHETFWRDLLKGPGYEWANADELKKVAEATRAIDPSQLAAEALKKSMPAAKTSAQLNAFRCAFDASIAVVTAIFERDPAREVRAREILDMAFATARHATEGAQRGDHDEPDADPGEYDVLRGLLAELHTLHDLGTMAAWYEATKDRREAIKSDALRETLIGSIRARKFALTRA